MRVLSLLKRKWSSKLIALIFGLSLATVGLGLGTSNADATLGGPFNCDANAVIYCGASSASQVVSKYSNGDGRNSAGSIQNVFNYFGISPAAVQAMPTTAVAGSVTSSGQVFVNGKEVANSAITAGRQYISGSTAVNYNGMTFYKRPPSVSFASSPLSAYVVMSGGRFQFAILSSCGNPVIATPIAPPPAPKPAPAPAPKPAPPAPSAAPTAQCNNLTLDKTSVTTQQQVTATVNFSTQNGASLKNVSFDWGDSTVVSTGTVTTASHTYSRPGTYSVQATLTFNGTSNQTVAPSTCTASIMVQAPPATPAVTTSAPAPPAPPAPPQQLINTGPGSMAEIAGLFVTATAAGYFAYRIYLSRRLVA